MRYFYSYSNMLAAAWMMAKHRMRFTDKQGVGIHPLFDAYSVKWYFDKTPECAASAAYFGEAYYVHPESFHLLEPREGDQGLDSFGLQVEFKTGGWIRPHPVASSADEEGIMPVIIDKRAGMAFMWPEIDHG